MKGFLETSLVKEYLATNSITFNIEGLQTTHTISSTGYVTAGDIFINADITEAQMYALVDDVESNQSLSTTYDEATASTDATTVSTATLIRNKNEYYDLYYIDGNGDEQLKDLYGDDPSSEGAAGSATTDDDVPPINTAPTAPTTAVSGITTTGATITYSGSTDSEGYIDMYRLFQAGTLIDTVDATVAGPYTTTLTGLTEDTLYKFTAYAVDDEGLSSAGTLTTFTTDSTT